MRRLLTGLFWSGFILFCITFFLGLLSTIVNPNTFPYFAFFGLAFPITLIALVFYFIYWAWNKNKKALYPLFLLILTAISLPNEFNWNFLSKKRPLAEELKVMTYNVYNFDAYNKDKKEGKVIRDKILDLIANENPDIICLQEAYDQPQFINIEESFKTIGFPYSHLFVGAQGNANGKFGVAIISKYPIIKAQKYNFDSQANVGSQVTIQIDSIELSVFNMHLQSINLDDSYYNYTADELADIQNNNVKYRLRRLKYLLTRGFKKRAQQAQLMHKEIKACKNPKIVCGDFNDTPVSFAYTKVKGGLRDSFKRGRFGFGNTYTKLPFLRIDQILYSKQLEAVNYKIVKKKLSDHYPVVSTFHWKEN